MEKLLKKERIILYGRINDRYNRYFFAAVALMFLVPLVLLADRNDDISQLIANSATSSFVENIIKTGTITSEDYANYINQLNSSGNTYDVSIEIKVLDPNYAQEYTNRRNELGSNQYYSIYTTQIEEKLSNNGGNESNKKIVLKDGDVISVIAKNNNLTLSQSLKKKYLLYNFRRRITYCCSNRFWNNCNKWSNIKVTGFLIVLFLFNKIRKEIIMNIIYILTSLALIISYLLLNKSEKKRKLNT